MENGFIAYVGTEIDEKEIKRLLGSISVYRTDINNENYIPRIRKSAGAIFGQVIKSGSGLEYSLPYLYNNLLYVASYDYDRLATIAKDFNKLYYGKIHLLLPLLLKDFAEGAFKLLEKKGLQCAFACYDKKTKQFTIAKIGDTQLFYGFTKQNHEIIFSDYEEVIQEVCGSVYKFPDSSFYRDGAFHGFQKQNEEITYENPEVFEQQQNPKRNLLFNDFTNAKNLLDGLNEILFEITDTSLRAYIEKAFNDYFAGLEPHKKVDEFINENLSIEVQKRILEIIKQEIEKYNIRSQLHQQIDMQIENQITEAIDKKLEKVSIPTIHIIKQGETELSRTKAELFHEKFEEVLSLVQLDEPVMLIGPAGSGKNHVISQIARALGLHMYYTNNASNEFKLTGFIDAGGNYRETEFYKAFKNGGIFLLDEIDTSDPSSLIVINSALANGYMAFPHETIDRNPDFRMIAAANTWGKGLDLQYVGRNALDAATLDRFDNVFFDYDRKLEAALYPSDEVLQFMWSFRDAVEETKTPHIVSTRGIGKVYKKEINGIPVETILKTTIIRNLGQDDLNTLLGSMKNINNSNKYYSTAKTLKLGR